MRTGFEAANHITFLFSGWERHISLRNRSTSWIWVAGQFTRDPLWPDSISVGVGQRILLFLYIQKLAHFLKAQSDFPPLFMAPFLGVGGYAQTRTLCRRADYAVSASLL